jgi:hypothetical protein
MSKKPVIIETTYRVVGERPAVSPGCEKEPIIDARKDAPLLIFVIGGTLLALFVQNFAWVEHQLENHDLRTFLGALITTAVLDRLRRRRSKAVGRT